VSVWWWVARRTYHESHSRINCTYVPSISQAVDRLASICQRTGANFGGLGRHTAKPFSLASASSGAPGDALEP
jgi:hypothetical protein